MTTRNADRLDYIKMLFTKDHDEWQRFYYSDIQALFKVATGDDNGGSHAKVTALGADGTKGRRYVVEVWGPTADIVAMLMQAHHWEAVRRVDYRRELEHFTADQMRAAARYLSFRDAKRNTQLFDSRPRNKGAGNRDVGGIGLYYGSRKSDACGVIYKRGSERPAAEYRAQNKLAQTIGRNVAGASAGPLGVEHYKLALELMRRSFETFFDNRLGAEIDFAMANAAAQGETLNNIADQMGLFDETPEERAYWAGLTTEQQADLAGLAVTPTEKGWQDTTSSAPDRTSNAPVEWDDDDLPF